MLPITRNQSRWWQSRRIDWRKQYFAPHPHMRLIMEKLNTTSIGSLVEVGCGAGKNIFMAKSMFPDLQVGGTDINAEAIATAKQIFEERGRVAEILEVCPAHHLFLNDKSVDALLTDACLMYVGNINRVIREFKRVVRSRVIFVELHSESALARLKLRWRTGYRAYDFRSLMRRHGFYDVRAEKIPKELWSGEPWETYGHVITAKL